MECRNKTEDGKCKSDKRCKCTKTEEEIKNWFKDTLNVIELNEVCPSQSIFGSDFFGITARDIEALQEGKVLYTLGEYGMFIRLVDKEIRSRNEL